MASALGRDSALSAEVLRLRKRDEAAALVELQNRQAEHAQALAGLAAADSQRQQRKHVAQEGRQAFAQLHGSVVAGDLCQQAQRLRQAEQAEASAEQTRQQREAEVARCREGQETARQTFLHRRALREAAELFASQQKKAQQRARAIRSQSVEEEARDRFASAKRRGNS